MRSKLKSIVPLLLLLPLGASVRFCFSSFCSYHICVDVVKLNSTVLCMYTCIAAVMACIVNTLEGDNFSDTYSLMRNLICVMKMLSKAVA